MRLRSRMMIFTILALVILAVAMIAIPVMAYFGADVITVIHHAAYDETIHSRDSAGVTAVLGAIGAGLTVLLAAWIASEINE